MKKYIYVMLLVILTVVLLTACSCEHEWGKATCTTPVTCTKCGETAGEALGHEWANATCATPVTCTKCRETAGEALGHKWVDATCTTAKTCSVCNVIEGNIGGHTWVDATCKTPKTCSTCNVTEGNVGSHAWVDATCTTPKTCSVCNATEGTVSSHNWKNATCTTAKTCSKCGATEGSATGHNWKDATCTAPKTCSKCGATQGSAAGHSYTTTKTPATCTAQGYTTYVCKCGDTYKDNYTNPSHNYTNYKCTKCGAIDKSHSYEYLMAWVKENGTTSGNYTKFEYKTGSDTYALSYSAQYDSLSIQRSGSYEGTFTLTALYLDTFYYGNGFGDLEMCGYITPGTFTNNTAISYTKFNGDSGTRPTMAELSRLNICDLIEWLEWCLNTYGVGITIEDLGFISY